MADPPLRAVRAGTSVRAAVGALAEHRVDAVVSAGHTGAVVTAAVHALGRLRGLRRPAIAATLPALSGSLVLLDVGANTEAAAKVLVQHAALGAVYAQVLHGIGAPRVGLLSVGTEAGKGDRARQQAGAALAGATLPGRAVYIGQVEGYDVPLGGPADVVVTDGFTGNVLLKGIEGAYALAGGQHPGTPRAGALLGVPGTVVICHGTASGSDIASGIALAARLHRTGVPARIAEVVPLATAAGKGEV
jgi:glycerol-3-phosphate acyltransferase PlsX